MAPRRPAQFRPAAPELRRSARLQDSNNTPAPVLLAPVVTPENRVTKTKAATKSQKSTRRDCATCGRTLSPSSFPKHITETCEHSVTTCKACLKTWIATQLDNTTYDKLSCPECPQILQSADVKNYAAKDVFERFDELERRGIAENVPGWRWCFNPHCRAGQVHQPLIEVFSGVTRKGSKAKGKGRKKDTEDNICECKECGEKACVTCDRPFHVGETCAEYQKRLKQFEKEEQASLKTIEKVSKQCPSCKKHIQKNGGCDQVICTQCRCRFCFLCLTDYNTINKQGHANGCIYAKPGMFDPHANNGGVIGGGNNAVANNGGGGIGHAILGLLPRW